MWKEIPVLEPNPDAYTLSRVIVEEGTDWPRYRVTVGTNGVINEDDDYDGYSTGVERQSAENEDWEPVESMVVDALWHLFDLVRQGELRWNMPGIGDWEVPLEPLMMGPE